VLYSIAVVRQKTCLVVANLKQSYNYLERLVDPFPGEPERRYIRDNTDHAFTTPTDHSKHNVNTTELPAEIIEI